MLYVLVDRCRTRAKHHDIRSQGFQDSTSLLFDRRRCENQLPSGRGRVDDFLNPIQAFVAQHPVGLIDDDGADVRRLQLAPLDQFHDAPGRAHHDVRLGLELVDLPVGRRTADEQHRADGARCVQRKFTGLTMDLNGQFVGWRHDHDLGRSLRQDQCA